MAAAATAALGEIDDCERSAELGDFAIGELAEQRNSAAATQRVLDGRFLLQKDGF